jgi:polyhydroxyalkanoate synthesis regulator phasin
MSMEQENRAFIERLMRDQGMSEDAARAYVEDLANSRIELTSESGTELPSDIETDVEEQPDD